MKNLNTVSAGRKTVSMEQKEKKLAVILIAPAVDLGCIYKFDG